ncbi:protein fem-1 homolog B isoform X2 [Diorhabda carinulata]|uniref:protein fem-1 homolog B isoform X2 n=1 Tax=Diorhabda carinulata TaxID=1163345 RepID=UPI0025A0CB8D|nr:protein fem-1 homolog B isoform X2 [Diorhabda carinulata]
MYKPEESIKNRIYFASKDGMSIALYTLISGLDKTKVNELINERIEDDGQECTPLIIAAKNGHDKVVRMLLTNYEPNLEVEGIVRFDGYVIDGATALWCAACAGHLIICKYLIKAGADINHGTKTSSTPLRAACFDGRLDVVQYLIHHKADIHLANKYNNTCLMIASYKGHLEIVRYLLEKGANPNEKAHCGGTALHFASECGHVGVVKQLLLYDAKFSSNDVGMTAIKAAAEKTKEGVVEFLINREDISVEDKIEALELLGASFANDKENYNIVKAYKYMYLAMQLRYSDPDNPIKKNIIKPIEAYENWIECQTIQELQAISENHNSLHMEALTIRERILGTHNAEVPYPVIYRGAVFADNARFDRCLELWLHALRLRLKTSVPVGKDLLRFAQVFCQMLDVDISLSFDCVYEVFAAAVTELERNRDNMKKNVCKEDPETCMDNIEHNLTTTLYFLTILTKIMKTFSEEERFNIQRMVFTLNQLNMTQRNGYSLLHLACSSDTPVDEFHIKDVCKFPCKETTKLLINCGANVNAMDIERNTPLHIIVTYNKAVSDFSTMHSIVTDLIENGAHLDCVNKYNETPLDTATTGVAEIILKTQTKLSLRCMAANAIKTYSIVYRGQVPEALVSFIEMHGSGVKRKK